MHSVHMASNYVVDWELCCRWVHKKLLGEEGGDQETKLGDLLSAGIREVDGGHVHYRDLYKADRYTDLSHGFRYFLMAPSCCVF